VQAHLIALDANGNGLLEFGELVKVRVALE
jgi:hypothetical protein